MNLVDFLLILSNTLKSIFRHNAYRLIYSNRFVTNVEDICKQKEILEYHHETKTCHRGINETLEALKIKYYGTNRNNTIRLHKFL